VVTVCIQTQLQRCFFSPIKDHWGPSAATGFAGAWAIFRRILLENFNFADMNSEKT